MAFGPYSPAASAVTFGLLYLGPLLAGLSGEGTATIPVFALLLLLYIAASRRPNLHETSGWVALGLLLVGQIALATGLVAAGMILATFIAPLALPLWVPVGISMLAAIYGVWRFSPSAEMDVFLDSAIERLEALNRDAPSDWTAIHPAADRDAKAAVDVAVTEAHALEIDATPREFDPIAVRLEKAAGIAAFDPLYDAAADAGSTPDPRLSLLLLRFASSDRMRRALIARGEVALPVMFLMNAPDPTVRAEARDRLAQLIEENAPDEQLPDRDWLLALEAHFPGEGFAGLAETRETLSKA